MEDKPLRITGTHNRARLITALAAVIASAKDTFPDQSAKTRLHLLVDGALVSGLPTELNSADDRVVRFVRPGVLTYDIAALAEATATEAQADEYLILQDAEVRLPGHAANVHCFGQLIVFTEHVGAAGVGRPDPT